MIRTRALAREAELLAVGLTGGIGSGKSTVARLLVERGAALVDADEIAREVAAPGGAAYEPLIERFGKQIVLGDGSLDRKAIAAVAFADSAALEDLNAITHPAIGTLMLERKNAHEESDDVVVLDIPLLKPAHRDLLRLDAVVVVDCPVEIAVERLVKQRGFGREDAEARATAQISRAERLQGADFVVDNSGDENALGTAVARLWSSLGELAPDRTV